MKLFHSVFFTIFYMNLYKQMWNTRNEAVRLSNLVVGIDFEQLWENSLQVVFYELFSFQVHGGEENRPEATASFH